MPDNPFEDVDNLVKDITKIRQRNLLIMYYAENGGSIHHDDKKTLYEEFRRRNLDPDKEKIEIDIILHTTGGDPDTSYILAEIVRDFSSNVNILIPHFAYSGGTLFSFCANKIFLGHYACLSPIDISYGLEQRTELINVDYFIEFVNRCRGGLEATLDEVGKQFGRTSLTKVEEPLLVELVDQVGALRIGRFFRERTLTGHYAEILLTNYLLSNLPPTHRQELSADIIRKLLFECPSHEFEIDYQLAKNAKIPVDKMNTKLSDLTKNLIEKLKYLESQNIICKYVGENYKSPFFRLYVGSIGGRR